VGAAAVLIHLRRFLPLLPSRRRRPVLGPPPLWCFPRETGDASFPS
jgi:hypothetical protein